MIDSASLDKSFTELGQRLDIGQIVAFEGRDYWEIAVDDQIGLTVQGFDDGARLMFQSYVTQVNPDREADYYRLLLEYNYTWDETGGARFALEPERGLVVLQYELPIGQADTETLGAVIQTMSSVSVLWREALESEGNPQIPVDPDSDEVVLRA